MTIQQIVSCLGSSLISDLVELIRTNSAPARPGDVIIGDLSNRDSLLEILSIRPNKMPGHKLATLWPDSFYFEVYSKANSWPNARKEKRPHTEAMSPHMKNSMDGNRDFSVAFCRNVQEKQKLACQAI